MGNNGELLSFWILLLAAFLFLPAGFLGCGKKAPPVPPGPTPLQFPVELKGTVQHDTVYLTWRHANPGPGRYVVSRAASDASKPDCQGCPLIFQELETLTVDKGTETVEFKDSVMPGFIYRYRVQSLTSSGNRGLASNMVVIDTSLNP